LSFLQEPHNFLVFFENLCTNIKYVDVLENFILEFLAARTVSFLVHSSSLDISPFFMSGDVCRITFLVGCLCPWTSGRKRPLCAMFGRLVWLLDMIVYLLVYGLPTSRPTTARCSNTFKQKVAPTTLYVDDDTLV
jgi:hypothetical protein